MHYYAVPFHPRQPWQQHVVLPILSSYVVLLIITDAVVLDIAVIVSFVRLLVPFVWPRVAAVDIVVVDVTLLAVVGLAIEPAVVAAAAVDIRMRFVVAADYIETLLLDSYLAAEMRCKVVAAFELAVAGQWLDLRWRAGN